MSGLPKGWANTKLKSVTSKIGSGSTPTGGKSAYQTAGVPFIRSMNVRFDGIDFDGLAYLSAPQAEKLASVSVATSDVLLNITGASIGRVTIAPMSLSGARVSQHVSIIRPKDGLEPKYLSNYLASPVPQLFINTENYGVTRQALTKSMIENFELPIPPLAEQRRIVAKIDRLSARSKRARAELGHVPTLIARVKERLLDLALSGALTVDWRRRCRMPDWSMTTLSTLLNDGPTNGWSPKSGDDATGALTLKLTATTSGKLRLDAQATKRIYETPEPNSKFWLEPGDILIQRANTIEYVGTAAIFDGPAATYIFPDLMMRIRPVDLAATRFLWIYLNAPSTKRYFQSKATGTAGNMPKINGETVRMLPVPVIDPKEREEIVRRIEHAFAAIDRLAAEATSAQKLLDRLDQAVLAKAFRGELVPQDPNDEPASVLLERIRAERAAAPAPKRGRRPKAAS